MRWHRQSATALPGRNLGAAPEISECDHLLTGSKYRFGIGASRVVPTPGRINIRIRPEGYGSWCTSTHAPGENFCPGTEFCKTSALSTVSECRF
ncbi:hypothetical protein Taro_056195 [Colocasia esculenta]|uniref:Uncharacterized protein n=1 Tax=Colocasia esculenta TaxID=4460 RepID=A0A843XVS3_COLES|nr:hypothetical protein [Colocasia esculenta]